MLNEMLSSGMKCYHLELMLSSGTKCYHLGLHVIIWDAMFSSARGWEESTRENQIKEGAPCATMILCLLSTLKETEGSPLYRFRYRELIGRATTLFIISSTYMHGADRVHSRELEKGSGRRVPSLCLLPSLHAADGSHSRRSGTGSWW